MDKCFSKVYFAVHYRDKESELIDYFDDHDIKVISKLYAKDDLDNKVVLFTYETTEDQRVALNKHFGFVSTKIASVNEHELVFE